jgi:hypothetical protein
MVIHVNTLCPFMLRIRADTNRTDTVRQVFAIASLRNDRVCF